MKAFNFFALSLTFLLSCHTSSKIPQINDSVIKGTKITQIFPRILNDGKLRAYDTSFVFIYYNGKQVLYHITSEIMNVDLVALKFELSGKTSYYDFIFTKGNKNGLLLNRIPSEPEKVVPIDSILHSEWVNNMNLYSVILNNETHLILSKKITSSILEEVYSLRDIKDTSMNGKMILNFSTKKLANNFSLSRELDSIKKMSLIKVRIINAPRYLKSAGINIDGAESGYDLEELKDIDESKLLPLFLKEKALNLD